MGGTGAVPAGDGASHRRVGIGDRDQPRIVDAFDRPGMGLSDPARAQETQSDRSAHDCASRRKIHS